MPTVFQLRASLRGIEPAVWRRVRVAADIPLADLHEVLQTTMGWQDYHLHEFAFAGRRFGPDGPDGADGVEDEWTVPTCELLAEPGDRVKYLYDFGDGWDHEVVLENVIEADATMEIPVCIAGERACPPEDSGGPHGYSRLCEALGDPEHEGHDAASEWLGEDYDPELVHVDAINASLEELFTECWIGGVLPLPAEMADDLPVPHSLVVWLDERYGTIVGRDVVPLAEGGEAAVASVLRVLGETVSSEGHTPVRLRVADPSLASRLRSHVGKDVEVVEGPTPELAELREAIAEQVAAQMGTCAEPTSYLDGGRIAPERMARFFEAAARLYRARPWESLGRGDILVVESSDLGLEGAVVLVAGEVAEDFGILVFDGAEECGTFLEGPGDALLDPTGEAPAVPTRIVHYERGASVPPPMRREIGRHLWEVADATAYPLLAFLDPEGVARHIDLRELGRITACTDALAQLLEQRRADIEAALPVADTVTVEGLPEDVSLRVSVGLRANGPDCCPPDGRRPEVPERTEWLVLDDTERRRWIRQAHYGYEPHPETPDFELHLSMHVAIETQIATGDPPEAEEAVLRLADGGLERHEAVHAAGSVMAREMWRALQGPPFDRGAYVGGLEALTVEGWKADAEARAAPAQRGRPARGTAKEPGKGRRRGR